MLSVLHECKSDNAILVSFREYWDEFERITQSYRSLPVKEWPDWQAVNGFYDEMKSKLEESGCWAGYGYVANPSGGFWGFWYGDNSGIFEFEDFKAEIYLQVEASWNYEEGHYDFRICLKISNKNSDDKKEDLFRRLRNVVVEGQSDYGFIKPRRLGSGQHITTGILDTSLNSTEEFRYLILSSVDKLNQIVEIACSKMKS